MNRFFYLELATGNIKKNGKFYFPYLLTCICTVAMFYIMCAIAYRDGLSKMPGAQSVQQMMGLGCYVIGIFAVIFLFYTNSFLMKRRKKEIGLYNILGMEKRHIAKILSIETLLTGVVGIGIGLCTGILFDKLLTLLLFWLLKFKVPLGFSISGKGIVTTLILFGCIFALTLGSNLVNIHLTKPIELLKGGNVGEKEPKSKWLMALLGAVSLAAGYGIALTVKSPLEAFTLFFVAVLLVIFGTYCLFTSGSIVILKLLRKNQRFYYQTRHFISVSGMIYRMKQNAVGLANICILSTMVLVILSTTVSMYLGVEDALDYRYPYDVQVMAYDSIPGEDKNELTTLIRSTVEEQGLQLKNWTEVESLSFTVGKNENTYSLTTGNYFDTKNATILCIMTAKEYEKMAGRSIQLKKGEIALYNQADVKYDSLSLGETQYVVKEQLSSFPFADKYDVYLSEAEYMVVSDEATLIEIDALQKKTYKERAGRISEEVSFDLTGTDGEKVKCATVLMSALKQDWNGTYSEVRMDCKQMTSDEFYALYGGFLFLGIFLGALFLMATTLIIYYKQISEGYDDKERFEIMQKVGMSKEEIKSSIRSQVVKVFFLPIAMATVHVAFAFGMITKLLALFNLTNVQLFFWCSVGTVSVFALIYGAVYLVTAKIYYRIVS